MESRLTGLIAATCTPFAADGSLALDPVGPMVDRLVESGVAGLYVCGSTGEGMLLTGEERRAVAEAYTRAAAGRLPVVVQVGHNSVREARELAEHAQAIGAQAISATPPSYFRPTSMGALVDCMGQVAAAAPKLPFYYYHIPLLTGAEFGMVEFLAEAGDRIPTLVGLKYTAPTADEYQACLQVDGGRFDILWGRDEMLLSALVVGARGAVGSTYNIAAPLYLDIIRAFEAGALDEARRLQAVSVEAIRQMASVSLLSALKELLRGVGIDCGSCRAPLPQLTDEQVVQLRRGVGAVYDVQRVE